jgi:hypothetical protein
MKKSISLAVAPFLALTVGQPQADASTEGQAIPTLVCPTSSGEYVGFVLVDITRGWLNSPHAVKVTITSNNGVPDEPHGVETHLIASLLVNGDIQNGVAEAIIPWNSDGNPTTIDHEYQVSAQLIYANNQFGKTVTVGGFRFSDCAF